jgi:hypothetical protein
MYNEHRSTKKCFYSEKMLLKTNLAVVYVWQGLQFKWQGHELNY